MPRDRVGVILGVLMPRLLLEGLRRRLIAGVIILIAGVIVLIAGVTILVAGVIILVAGVIILIAGVIITERGVVLAADSASQADSGLRATRGHARRRALSVPVLKR
jgi:hypothetical protein